MFCSEHWLWSETFLIRKNSALQATLWARLDIVEVDIVKELVNLLEKKCM